MRGPPIRNRTCELLQFRVQGIGLGPNGMEKKMDATILLRVWSLSLLGGSYRGSCNNGKMKATKSLNV